MVSNFNTLTMVFVVKLSYTNGNQSAKNMVTTLYYSKAMVDFGKGEKETRPST